MKNEPSPRYDVLIICPLEEEFLRCTAALDLHNELTEKTGLLSFEFSVSGSSLVGVVCKQRDSGDPEAYFAADTLCRQFHFSLIICVGIAGRLSSDLQLGDVCYSTTIIDVMVGQKITDNSSSFDPRFYHTPDNFVQSLNYIRAHPALIEFYYSWQSEAKARFTAMVDMFSTPQRQKLHELSLRENPIALHGQIVSGPVSASAKLNKQLKSIARKALVIETESAGIFRVAQEHKIPAVTFRGVSDNADATKKSTEDDFKEAFRKLSIDNAVSFLKAQLSSPAFIKVLTALKAPVADFPADNADPIATAHAFLRKSYEEHLRALSPEYRAKRDGYQPPLPRLLPLEERYRAKPVELEEEINRTKLMGLVLPENYPDRGLPWLVGQVLLQAMVAERLVTPIVIDASLLVPPNRNLEAAIPAPANSDAVAQNTQRVFILHNLPAQSETRMRYIEQQLQGRTNDRFIFITNRSDIVSIESSSKYLGTARYFVIDKISFKRIASFISVEYGIEQKEAETIAYRLHNIFTAHKLVAHPTYFAGISKETLSALLHANRRAELIELAVSGLLTILVADDSSAVPVSRTTRKRFLQELAVRIRIQYEKITERNLIDLAESFAGKHDLDVVPTNFLQDFFAKGILCLVGDEVRFAYTYVSAYLIGDYLSKNSQEAIRYFSPSNENIDFEEFDIYCELGIEPNLVHEYVVELRRAIIELQRPGDQNILFQRKINPLIFRSAKTAKRLRQSAEELADKLLAHGSEAEEKQVLLDLMENTRSRATDTNKRVTGRPERRQNDSKTFHGRRNWALCGKMLSAASEILDRDQKRELVSLIVEFADKSIDSELSKFANFPSEEIFSELISSKEYIGIKSKFESIGIRGELDEFVRFIIGISEFMACVSPFMATLGFLTENVRDRVLLKSVVSAELSGGFAGLVRELWAADIDPKAQKASLIEVIKSTPIDGFLRVSISNHLLNRVFWAHAEKGNREALLDAAVVAVKNVEGHTIDKGSIESKIREHLGMAEPILTS